MKNPTWHVSTPLFFSADTNFCFISYFCAIDGGIYRTPGAKDPENGIEYEDIDVNQTKLVADFHDIEHWEQIGVNGVFTIYWNIDSQIILVTDQEESWESERISLLYISKTEREEYLVKLADTFIASLLQMLYEQQQQKSEPTLFECLMVS